MDDSKDPRFAFYIIWVFIWVIGLIILTKVFPDLLSEFYENNPVVFLLCLVGWLIFGLCGPIIIIGAFDQIIIRKKNQNNIDNRTETLCTIRKNSIEYEVWIPTALAKKGNYIGIKKNGEWYGGWLIIETHATRTALSTIHNWDDYRYDGQ